MAEDPKNAPLVLLVESMWGGLLTLAGLGCIPLHLAVFSLAQVLSSHPDWKLQ